MIPDEAVEAAREAYLSYKDKRTMHNARDAMRVALEAALPHLASAAKQPQRTSPTDWPDVPRRQ